MQQPLEQIGPPLAAHPEAAAAEQPREAALDDLAVSTKPLDGVDPPTGNPGRDTARAQGTVQDRGVIRFVGVKQGLALAASTLEPPPPSAPDDARSFGLTARELDVP